MKNLNLHCPCRRIQGLTLGEMLIVLAVFLVLGIMFIFSSQNAIEKSKYSRVLQEQRTVVSALSSYMGDYMSLPSEQGLSALLQGRNPYIASLPTDIFRFEDKDKGRPLFEFYGDNLHGLIVSAGPDGDLDVEAALAKRNVGLAGDIKRLSFKSSEEAQEFIARYSYDPTNGVGSDGDVITSYSPLGY